MINKISDKLLFQLEEECKQEVVAIPLRTIYLELARQLPIMVLADKEQQTKGTELEMRLTIINKLAYQPRKLLLLMLE